MEIRKADSKGRVTGFKPGTIYEIYEAGGKTYVSIYAYGFPVGKEVEMEGGRVNQREYESALEDVATRLEHYEPTVLDARFEKSTRGHN